MSTRIWQILWLGDLAEYEDIFNRELFERYRDVAATRLVAEEDEKSAAFARRVEDAVSERAFDLVVVEGDQATPKVFRTLRNAGPALRVLLIAGPHEGERIVDAYELGVDGYVTRTDDESVFRQLLAKQVFEHLSRNLDPPSTRRPTANELLRYAHYYNVLHPFFVFDVDDRLRYVNQAGREFIRESIEGDAELVIGDPLQSLPLRELDTDLDQIFQQVRRGDEIVREHHFEEFVGETSLREVFYRPVFGAQGSVVAVSVSIYIPMHPELREVRRHAALGRLSASIAHDFNNILSIVSTGTAVLRRRLDRPGENHRSGQLEQFEAIDEAVKKGRRFTSRLLRYTGKAGGDHGTLSPVEFLESNRRFVQRLIGEDIEVTFELDSGTPDIQADPKQLEQVLMNLVANARDAMPTGGELRISCDTMRFAPEQKPPVDNMRPGTYVALAVSDTGEGMSPDAADSAFKPYFSTRDTAAHPGLGLASVRGIVRESRGFVELDTEPGGGTTVTIYLPAIATTRDNDASSSSAEQPQQPNVLIAEDEEGLRFLLRQLLDSCPCEIHDANSAEEAVELASKLDGVDLLISDIVLPGADGFELADRLEENNPNLEIIFMSGYTDDITDRSGKACGDRRRFIQKPFDPDTMYTLVEELVSNIAESERDEPGT